MSFRQKLLLKRALVIFAIVLVVIAVILVAGYKYLGRYVVYTEDGAYFQMGSETMAAPEEIQPLTERPEDTVLTVGESILETEYLGIELEEALEAESVYGIMLDYETLSDGRNLGNLDFVDTEYNTLVLEMRVLGSDILNNNPTLQLIQRAKDHGLKLVAKMSTLDDSEYALEDFSRALPIQGGALWVGRGHSYWLNPFNTEVQKYLLDMINKLIDMGFDEVLLDTFYFPTSTSIVYDTGGYTRDELLIEAYRALEDAVRNRCTLGIYIDNAEDAPHQAMYEAEHIYTYFSSGASLRTYSETYPNAYLVFVTDSHDTRFDDYGKIISDIDLSE